MASLGTAWVGKHVTMRDTGKSGVVQSAASGYFKVLVDDTSEIVFSRKFNMRRFGQPAPVDAAPAGAAPGHAADPAPPPRRRRPAPHKRTAPKILGGPVEEDEDELEMAQIERHKLSASSPVPGLGGMPAPPTVVTTSESSSNMSGRWIGARVVLRDTGMKGTVLNVGNGYFKILLDDEPGKSVSVRQANMRRLGETCKRSPNAASAAVAAAAMTQMAMKNEIADMIRGDLGREDGEDREEEEARGAEIMDGGSSPLKRFKKELQV